MTTDILQPALDTPIQLRDTAVLGAVERERITDDARGIAPDLNEPIIRAFLSDPMSFPKTRAETRGAISALTETLEAARKRHAAGDEVPSLATFAEYRSKLLRRDDPLHKTYTTLKAAATAAKEIADQNGLVTVEDDGRVILPKTSRRPEAVAATVLSVSALELTAARTQVQTAATDADQDIDMPTARATAEEAAEKAGINLKWALRKNDGVLRAEVTELLKHVPQERQSIDTYNRLAPITPIINKVLDRTPAVALIWLDTLSYATRGSDDLDVLTRVKTPGDIVRTVMAMTSLERVAWKRLANADPKLVGEYLLDLRRQDTKANKPLKSLMAEQYRWRQPLYDLMRLRARHGRPVNQSAEVAVYDTLLPLDDQGNYRSDPQPFILLALSFYRHTDKQEEWNPNDAQALSSVIDWAKSEVQEKNLEQIAKRPWEQYLMSSDRWHRELRLRRTPLLTPEQRKELKWESDLPRYTEGRYIVRPLLSHDDLAEVGEMMDHCLGYGPYALNCKNGYNRLFQIERDNKNLDPTPVATVQIIDNSKNGKWRLGQMQGPGNSRRKILPEVRRIAHTIPLKYKKAQMSMRFTTA